MPVRPNKVAIKKRLFAGIKRVKSGPMTMAMEKAKPMVMPEMAMALVRFSSRVKSAIKASSVLPMAPAPCSARPIIMSVIECERPAIKLPKVKMSNPKTMTGFRPRRSESVPKGI